MAKAIYSMKTVLYKFELDRTGADAFQAGQHEKMEKPVLFILNSHASHWMEAPLASQAPGKDPEPLRNPLHHCQPGHTAANAAIHARKPQGWHPSEEPIPPRLFEKTFDSTVKAEKLLRFVPRRTHPKRQRRGFNNPPPPENTSPTTAPTDLGGPNSALLLNALKTK